MIAAREPWWSSGVGPDEPPLDEHDDPVTAHRAARRGDVGGDGDGRTDEDDLTGEEDGPAHAADICGVCPICLGARLLGETRPELLAHLTEAARHLAAAARTLLDDAPGGPSSPQEPDEPVTRIDLD